MTCSRPQRTASGGLEPGTSRPKVLGFTTAPVRSTLQLIIAISEFLEEPLNIFQGDNWAFVSFTCHFLHFSVSGE